MKTQKRIEVEKNGDKYGKALSKFMNYAVYGKTMENLRKKMDVKLVSNERDYLKWTTKPSKRHAKYLTMIVKYVETKLH